MQKIKLLLPDLFASFVVFLVALPLCLGIALASGVPLSAGLYAGIIGGIVVGLLSGSSVSVSGPAAGLIAVVINAIRSTGSIDLFFVAVSLSGVLQIIFSLLRLGHLGKRFPSGVIQGLLSAVGATIIFKQYDIVFKLGMTSSILVFGVSFTVYLVWERMILRRAYLLQLIPPAIVAVISGVLISHSLITLDPSSFVAIPVTERWTDVIQLRSIHLSDFYSPGVWLSALTIAVIGSIETLINLNASDSLDPKQRKSSPNRELWAQGVANFICGLAGGLPITSVVVRSSANIMAGAQSRWSSVFHGFLLLIGAIWGGSWINRIPLPSLSAILVLIGWKLINPKLLSDVYKRGHRDFLPFLVTLVTTLAFDLLKGVLSGVLIHLLITKALDRRKK